MTRNCIETNDESQRTYKKDNNKTEGFNGLYDDWNYNNYRRSSR